MKQLRGSYTVLITPFTQDGASVDEAALRGLVEWQIRSGVPGLIILGSTGEFLSVSDEERACARHGRKSGGASPPRTPTGGNRP